MKKVSIFLSVAMALSVLAFFGFTSVSSDASEKEHSCTKYYEGGEESTMIIKLDNVTSKGKIKKFTKTMTAVNGITSVNVKEDGTATIKYIRATLGCCSKIHSTLKDNKYSYKMVSNDEKGETKSCLGEKGSNSIKKESCGDKKEGCGSSKNGKKSCCQGKK